jgi:hypothetical protein
MVLNCEERTGIHLSVVGLHTKISEEWSTIRWLCRVKQKKLHGGLVDFVYAWRSNCARLDRKNCTAVESEDIVTCKLQLSLSRVGVGIRKMEYFGEGTYGETVSFIFSESLKGKRKHSTYECLHCPTIGHICVLAEIQRTSVYTALP